MQIFQQILFWMEKNISVPKDKWGFKDGATEKQLAKAENTLGVQLPEDYKNLLKIHNGQDPVENIKWLHGGMFLLSIEDVVKYWKEHVELYKKYGTDLDLDELQEDERIRNIVHHEKRIMIAEQEGGNALMFDYIPAPKGSEGQLIFLYTECDFMVVGKTLTEFLEKYLQMLKDGTFYYNNDDYQQMTLKDHEKNPFFEELF